MDTRFFPLPRPLPTHAHADASQDAIFESIFISADALAPTPSTAPLPLSSMDDRRTRKASRGTCTRRASLRSTPVPSPPPPTFTPPHRRIWNVCRRGKRSGIFPVDPGRCLQSTASIVPFSWEGASNQSCETKGVRVGRRRWRSAWTKRVQTRLRSAREARPRRARWRNACGKVLGRTPDAEGKPTGDGSLLADRTVRRTSCTEDVDARVRTW